MSQPRIEMNAVMLPSGKILALGGSYNDEDTATASLNADLYDPASNTFSSAGANAYARLYHSVALLLPDATVWVAGGNHSAGLMRRAWKSTSRHTCSLPTHPATLLTPPGRGSRVLRAESITAAVSQFRLQMPLAFRR